jgi:FMN phosphatase YigB (HAD superfamily)
VVLTGELGTPKPAGAAFAAAAQRLGLDPGQLVMVGDHVFRDSLGALDAGYAHAFHMQRAGAFFNFDLQLCRSLLPTGRFTALTGLQELDWYLRKS